MEKLFEVMKFFDNHPFVFAVLYKREIIFMNKSFRESLGFSEEEIKNMTIFDLIKDPKQKEIIINSVEKRITGEEFSTPYKFIEVVNKKDKRFYVDFFAQTIKIEGDYAGLAIGFDSTYEYKKEFLLEILKDINHLIISKNSEDEIFKGITDTICKKGGYRFVISSIKNGKKFEIKYSSGADEEFLSYLSTIMNENSKKCMAAGYLKKGDMLVVNDLENIDFSNKKLLDELLKRGVKSLLFFPVYKNDEIFATIGITSKYKNDFDDLSVNVFKEAQSDIEFALEKIERFSYLEILKNAIDKTFAWAVITDENARIIYANKAVEELSKYHIDELIGKTPAVFKSGYHSKEFYNKMWEKLLNGKTVEALIINKSKDGNLFYLKNRFIPVRTPSGEKYFISLGMDITSEKRLKNRLKKDILTNLPNRSEFIEKSQRVIKKDKKYACIVIDITDFKIYNQIYGNESGDYILKEFAKFLRTFFYERDIIARIGGDEFAVLFEIDSYENVEMVVNKFIEKIKHSPEFQNKLAVNIGISLYPKDDTDIIKLLEKALFALQMAKDEGDFAYEFFEKIYDKKIIEYYDVKHIIIEAIQNKEFIYHFQPYVDAKNFEISGAETLLRIKKGDKIIYPNVFIDFLENSSYIKDVEKIMFPKYLEYLKKANIPLSFNISGKSLTDMDHISSLFENVKGPVVVELTEREIALNIEYTKKVFEYFKSSGIKLSIDDFGTGYSSLTYLKDLPADFLKIDMSFVKNIEHSKKDRAIVETIIHFAHNFELKTIAEGVETENQVKILQEMGCDYLQGYYFYKPMEFDDLMKVLK